MGIGVERKSSEGCRILHKGRLVLLTSARKASEAQRNEMSTSRGLKRSGEFATRGTRGYVTRRNLGQRTLQALGKCTTCGTS